MQKELRELYEEEGRGDEEIGNDDLFAMQVTEECGFEASEDEDDDYEDDNDDDVEVVNQMEEEVEVIDLTD